MSISDSFAMEIVKIEVSFSFAHFSCDPKEITRSLRVTPDEVMVKGKARPTAKRSDAKAPFNSWGVGSTATSRDVNVHFRELLDTLDPVAARFSPDWGTPMFGVVFFSSGQAAPYYEPDVLLRVGRLGAELYQDVYHSVEHQADQPDHST